MVTLEIGRPSCAEEPGETQKSLLNIPLSCNTNLPHELTAPYISSQRL